MKNISYSEAVDILSDCAAVIIDGVVTYPYFNDDGVSFSWEDEGYDFEVNFFESQNETVVVCGSSIFLTDKDGDDVQITILCEKNLD